MYLHIERYRSGYVDLICIGSFGIDDDHRPLAAGFSLDDVPERKTSATSGSVHGATGAYPFRDGCRELLDLLTLNPLDLLTLNPLDLLTLNLRPDLFVLGVVFF
jgi:hypothetical protein